MMDPQIQDDRGISEATVFLGFPLVNIGRMIVYSILTMGIYPYIWFVTRSDAINNMSSEKKIDKNIFIFLLILIILDTVISFSHILFKLQLGAFGTIFNFVWVLGIIIFLVQIFKIRDIFDDHFNGYLKKNEEFSKAFVFLFNVLYFQHKINKLCYNVKNFK